jgi:radical SAM protein with 4Fe4S-binding SPASM domain
MSLLSKIKYGAFLARRKGIKYAFNLAYFSTLFGTKNRFLIRLLYWLKPYPFCIEIETTTRCGLKCQMCEHTYWNEPNRDMTFEQFKMIIDQFPKLKWIGMTGIGESFLNRDFMKMLEYVKSKNIYVEFYDNLFYTNEKILKRLIELEIDKLYISIVGATKETYEKIMVNSDFDKVIKNMKTLIKLKHEMDAYFPELEFHYIVTSLNVHEMIPFLEFMHSLREPGIKVRFTRMLHSFKESEHLFTEVPQDKIEEVKRKGKQLDLDVEWNANVPTNKPPLNTCTEWIMPFIFVTGHVIPCCAQNEANKRDYQKATAMGNVFEKPFKEIWNGEKYENLRKMLKNGELHPACIDCPLYETKK